jgi:hypothetical protein
MRTIQSKADLVAQGRMQASKKIKSAHFKLKIKPRQWTFLLLENSLGIGWPTFNFKYIK